MSTMMVFEINCKKSKEGIAMGLLNSIMGKNSKKISSYEIQHVEESPEGQNALTNFSAIMDSTQSITWDSNQLKWYTYDDGEGRDKRASLAIEATFQREYGDGARTYLNGLEMSVGIVKSGKELVLTVMSSEELVVDGFPMPGFLIMIRAQLH